MIALQNIDRENAFSESDVRLLQTLATSMSVALENARLFDETQRLLKETEQRAAELAIINSVQEGLASKLDMQAIYDLVGDKIREIFERHDVAIASYRPRDTRPDPLPVRASRRASGSVDPQPIPRDGIGRVIVERTPAAADQRGHERSSIAARSSGSTRSRGNEVGCLACR